jgi:hypothetical protein
LGKFELYNIKIYVLGDNYLAKFFLDFFQIFQGGASSKDNFTTLIIKNGISGQDMSDRILEIHVRQNPTQFQ